MDIEELGMYGRKMNACPYYASLRASEYTDFVLSPYNYLLDNGLF
jgi:hypothetical protein